jgi:hypothetical protein
MNSPEDGSCQAKDSGLRPEARPPDSLARKAPLPTRQFSLAADSFCPESTAARHKASLEPRRPVSDL